jgi:O-antigen/teichoic acid export membrane protein
VKNEDPGSRFAKDFFSKFVGFSIPTWVSFFLSFLSVPITTRLFLPEEVGKINLFATYLTLIHLLALLGLDQSFIRFFNEPPSENDKNSLMLICLMFASVSFVVVSFFLFLFFPQVSMEISGEVNLLISICLSLSLIANIMMRYVGLYFRMENNIFLYSLQAILFTFIARLFYIVVALWKPTHQYAIISSTIGYCLLAIIFSIVIIKLKFKGRVNSKITLDKATIIDLFGFGLPLLPISLLSWLNNSLSSFLLHRYVSYSAIGIYTNAVAVAGIIGLVQAGFSTYWAPFIYANYQTEKENIAKVHRMITFLITAFGLIIILAQDLIYLLVGTSYRESRVFFPLLLLSPICYTIAETTGMGIEISKRSYLNIYVFLSSVGLNLLMSVVLMPHIGAIGAAIASGASSILMFTLKSLIGQKYYKTELNYFKTIASILIIVVASIVNLLFIDSITSRNLVILFLLFVLCLIWKTELLFAIKFGLSLVVPVGNTRSNDR